MRTHIYATQAFVVQYYMGRYLVVDSESVRAYVGRRRQRKPTGNINRALIELNRALIELNRALIEP